MFVGSNVISEYEDRRIEMVKNFSRAICAKAICVLAGIPTFEIAAYELKMVHDITMKLPYSGREILRAVHALYLGKSALS